MFPNEPFWIDAICIDQQSIRERNHQVQQMGQIYSGASEVIVWLGLEIKSRSLAIDFLLTNKVGRQKALASRKSDESKHDLAERICDHLVALCHDEYWDRTWIIQEFLLARRVIIMSGTLKMDFDVLSSFLALPSSESSNLLLKAENMGEEAYSSLWHSRARLLCDERRWTNGRMYEYSLEDLLCKFGQSKCSDIRDRVLGLLGLTSYGRHNRFRVDYSMDKAQLFRYFVSFCTRSPVTDGRALAKALALDWAKIEECKLAPAMRPPLVPISDLFKHRARHDLLPDERSVCRHCDKMCSHCDKTLTMIVRHGRAHSISEYPSLCPDSVQEISQEEKEAFPLLEGRGPTVIGNICCVDHDSNATGHLLFDGNGAFIGFVLDEESFERDNEVLVELFRLKESFLHGTELKAHRNATVLGLRQRSFLSLLAGDPGDANFVDLLPRLMEMPSPEELEGDLSRTLHGFDRGKHF
ncbi:hypothetical protein H2200_011102 [Cladophialophora chaetospira]|uniref:Heterokaryon incompatibility domain-containing protein n=1 Tax=Cladophialophora chaetospira TaxID=386627 RepID=A0AA39CDG4_9EURO|nr:hypothetical protein H2200_011102 [Cladophialophora chaetospira]